jgi:hypothetical protein
MSAASSARGHGAQYSLPFFVFDFDSFLEYGCALPRALALLAIFFDPCGMSLRSCSGCCE